MAGQVELHAGYMYGADSDSLATAILVTWCFYGVVYTALTILCYNTLMVSRGYIMPFIPLIVALALACIQSIASIVIVVLSANGLPTPSKPVIVAMSTIHALSRYWSIALLFLSICYLLTDRFTDINQVVRGRAGSISALMTMGYALTFVLLLISGSAAAGLHTHFEVDDFPYSKSESMPMEPDLAEKTKIYRNALYAFHLSCLSSAILVANVSSSICNTMYRMSVSDKVTKTTFFVCAPLYFVLVVVDHAFSILLLMPNVRTGDVHFREGVLNVAYILLSNSLYVAVAGAIVIQGLQPSRWLVTGRHARELIISEHWEHIRLVSYLTES